VDDVSTSLDNMEDISRAAQKLKLPGSTDFRTQNFLRKRVILKQI
jgi:hypothetical protein